MKTSHRSIGLVVLAAGFLAPVLLWSIPSVAVPLLMVDNFERPAGLNNMLNNRANVFTKAPSKAMASVYSNAGPGNDTHVLMIRYEKNQTGGPSNTGGWAGYYTLLKSPGVAGEEERYLDASGYKALTFRVRGEIGNENFVIGLSDRYWDRMGDSAKSQEIGQYLPAGKLTTEWQKATVPFDEFFIDYTQLSGISVVFDGDLFPVAGSAGKIYLDDIALE